MILNKYNSIFSVVLFVLFSGAFAFGAENLLKNGELAGPAGAGGLPAGWAAYNDWAAVKYDAEAKCVHIDNVTEEATLRQGGLMLDPGKRYRLSCQVKTEEFDGGGGVTVINSGWKWTCGLLRPEVVTAGWTKLEKVFTPASSDNGEYQLVIYSAGSDGKIFVKDIKLELVEGAAVTATAGEFEDARKARQKPVYSARDPVLNICLRDGRMRCLVNAVVTNSSTNAGSVLVCVEELDGEKWRQVASAKTAFSGSEEKKVTLETPVELAPICVNSSLLQPAKALRVTGRGKAAGRAYFKLPIPKYVKAIKLSVVDRAKPELKCETGFSKDGKGNKNGKIMITMEDTEGGNKPFASREYPLTEKNVTVDFKTDKLPTGRLLARACVKDAFGKFIYSQELKFARLSKEPERLNNIVCRLEKGKLKLEKAGTKEIVFENPRDGWVWIKIKTVVAGEGSVTISKGDEKWLEISANGEKETMRWHMDGTHRLTVSGTAESEVDYEIKSVPELILSAYNYSPNQKNPEIKFGPYDAKYLKDNGVLRNVNGLMGGYWPEKGFPEEWVRSGGRWFCSLNLPFKYGADKKDDFTPEDVFKVWSKNALINNDLISGYFLDEFTSGAEKGIMQWLGGMRLMLADQRFKDKAIYPYLQENGASIPDYVRFVVGLYEAAGTRPCIEWYPHEEPTEEKAARVFREFRDAMADYEQKVPGLLKRSLFALFFASMVGSESSDIYPDVDYKVFLDLQFNMLANDPVFKDFGGVQWYTSGYVDDETMRWCSALFRHYAIEGRRDKLSGKYGFKYELKHIVNGDFDKGLEGWETKSAEEGKMAVKEIKRYGVNMQCRYNANDVGSHVLWMKRTAKAPNVAAQSVKGLEAGKLYSLKMMSGDYGELMAGKSIMTNHVMSVKVENVEVIPDKSFVGIMATTCWSKFGFDEKAPYCLNYHWLVFRAKGNEARLTISDWADEKNVGGPEGQELVCNFIQVQPFFAE